MTMTRDQIILLCDILQELDTAVCLLEGRSDTSTLSRRIDALQKSLEESLDEEHSRPEASKR